MCSERIRSSNFFSNLVVRISHDSSSKDSRSKIGCWFWFIAPHLSFRIIRPAQLISLMWSFNTKGKPCAWGCEPTNFSIYAFKYFWFSSVSILALIHLCLDFSGVVAILHYMGFRSTYAMHDNNALSSNKAGLLKHSPITAGKAEVE